jgi:hypothetical protein
MSARTLAAFSTIRTEGAMLPSDILVRVASGDKSLGGLEESSYHLAPGEKIGEATNRAWNRLQAAWANFQSAREKLAATDTGTSLTRERWLLPLFQLLDYGRLQAAKAEEIGGKSYAISHAWQQTPIHLVGCNVDLDRRIQTATGGMRSSPHSLLQELLNRNDQHLWGIVSNGLRLRLLRDNISLTRQAYVEFDLEAMMAGEAYPDFVLLWLLLHQSRFEAERPEQCQLEKWSQAARTEGVRVLDGLRDGVQHSIEHLGQGFLAHPANTTLREHLRSGALDKQDYYRQILRLVYRLLFLFVADDRDLLLAPTADPAAQKRYRDFYATTRLRHLATRRAGSRHHDLYCGLKLVMEKLSGDGCTELALPALGSFLFSPRALPDLNACEISNLHLLEAIRSLSVTQTGQSRRVVDYKNLGAEELGSVYESLLELHPDLNPEAATFELKVAAGSERKKTGSYYTPTSLISCLLDSALEPVLIEAAKQPDPEAAILKLKVVDPACGSGHFLIAAAHRIAKQLAAVRTGEEEPPPEAQHKAIRDVIGHCIYGVDVNPMAVELCKVSLWMEALEPGKPLSFLEHRVQSGNSLLGAAPALLAQGIPDDAFTPIEGDDKEICREFKRINKDERNKQMRLFAATTEPWLQLGNFAASLMNLDMVGDDSIEGIRKKERMYEEAIRSGGYLDGRFWADTWCAAFVWKKTREFSYPVTEEVFRRIERNPHACEPWMQTEIERISSEYRFFHWHLAFPDVFRTPPQGTKPENAHMGWVGGFHVVLGNPPWERIKLQEKEWFAERRPDIATAANASLRRKRITELRTEDPLLYAAFQDALRHADGESAFIRHSGRFPLCAQGDINTYAIFAETALNLLAQDGMAGIVVPDGIANSATTADFFQSLVVGHQLHSMYGFKNERFLFVDVEHTVTFALLTIGGSARPAKGMEFCWLAWTVEEMLDPARRVVLTADDILLINPNTKTCPTFRTQRDAELIKSIYRRVPVLRREGPPEENPWGLRFTTIFHMSNDSDVFRTREQLDGEGWAFDGRTYTQRGDSYVRLYEGRLGHQFNHRFASESGGEVTESSNTQLQDPGYLISTQYFVPFRVVRERLLRRPAACSSALLGFRRIARDTDIRTSISTFLPYEGVSYGWILCLGPTAADLTLLNATFNSFVFDYLLRNSLAQPSIPQGTFEQVAAPGPSAYTTWQRDLAVASVLELSYTSRDLSDLARDLGYLSPPFQWELDRRFLLRAELDALYFHLYELDRAEADYILDRFPIIRRKDEAAYGEYRTKRVILEIYDAMAEAERAGVPYQTRLDPPPADPRVAHQEESMR